MSSVLLPPCTSNLIVNDELASLDAQHRTRTLLAVDMGINSWGLGHRAHALVCAIHMRPLEFYYRVGGDWSHRAERLEREYPREHPLVSLRSQELRGFLRNLDRRSVWMHDWVHSDMVYQRDDQFHEALRELASSHYPSEQAYHYYMANAHETYKKSIVPAINPSRRRRELGINQFGVTRYAQVIRNLHRAIWCKLYPDRPPTHYRDLLEAIPAPAEVMAALETIFGLIEQGFMYRTMNILPEVNAYIEALFATHRYKAMSQLKDVDDGAIESRYQPIMDGAINLAVLNHSNVEWK